MPTSEVADWLKGNPKEGVRRFLSDKFGVPADERLVGEYSVLQISAYNKMARVRRDLGIPPPTKGG